MPATTRTSLSGANDQLVHNKAVFRIVCATATRYNKGSAKVSELLLLLMQWIIVPLIAAFAFRFHFHRSLKKRLDAQTVLCLMFLGAGAVFSALDWTLWWSFKCASPFPHCLLVTSWQVPAARQPADRAYIRVLVQAAGLHWLRVRQGFVHIQGVKVAFLQHFTRHASRVTRSAAGPASVPATRAAASSASCSCPSPPPSSSRS